MKGRSVRGGAHGSEAGLKRAPRRLSSLLRGERLHHSHSLPDNAKLVHHLNAVNLVKAVILELVVQVLVVLRLNEGNDDLCSRLLRYKLLRWLLLGLLNAQVFLLDLFHAIIIIFFYFFSCILAWQFSSCGQLLLLGRANLFFPFLDGLHGGLLLLLDIRHLRIVFLLNQLAGLLDFLAWDRYTHRRGKGVRSRACNEKHVHSQPFSEC